MRTVLVGIDPGDSGDLEPLSPENGSGARLARLFRLDHAAFLRTFDRVNLYPTPGDHTPSEDRLAGANLLPILRGRRVIALGSRVARAIDAGGRMLWSIRPGGFVGAYLPDPPELNRWWNDPGNEARAAMFLGDSLKPTIIVEGPDGAGKSTLVRSLVDAGMVMVARHLGPPTLESSKARIEGGVLPGYVSDRYPAISGPIYQSIVGGGQLPRAVLEHAVDSILHCVTIVYCRPPYHVIAGNNVLKDGEDQDFARRVNENLDQIVRAYDRAMAALQRRGARVVYYDWTRNRPNEVLACAA